MIKYNLKCKNKHEFESWFSDSKEFEKLKKKKLLECIYCNSKNVEKSIMSPRVVNSKESFSYDQNKEKELKKLKGDLKKLRKFVEKNFEFVGDNFAKKVREVYYDQSGKKKYLWHYYKQRKRRVIRGRNKFSQCTLGRRRKLILISNNNVVY